MIYVRQPPESNLCGQACVAMLSAKPLDDIVRLIGHDKGTKTKELVQALHRLGISCDTKLTRGNPGKDQTAIVKLIPRKGHKGGWHWAISHKGKMFDPDPYCGWTHVSSYLEIINFKEFSKIIF